MICSKNKADILKHKVVYDTYDVTWDGFDLWIWTAVEVNLGVICGCVPSLKPLVFRYRSRSTTYGGSNTNGSTSKRKSNTLNMELSIVDRGEVITSPAFDFKQVEVQNDEELGLTRAIPSVREESIQSRESSPEFFFAK